MSDVASEHSVKVSGLSGNPFFAPADGRCLINELPTELLSHIFMLGSDCDCGDCAEDDEDDEDDCCSHSTVSTAATEDDDAASVTNSEHDRHLSFKLLVSRVCRQWREVAIGTPLLWNIINYERPRDVERITEYVKRAKGAPLDISIDCTAADDDDDNDDDDSKEEKTDEEYYQEQIKGLQKVVQILYPEVQHWRTFEVMVSDYGLMQSALNVLASCKSAPLLEELRLYHYEDSEERDTFEPAEFREQDFVLFNNDVPRLREVALWGVHLNWERTTFLTGLEELELAYHSKDVRPSYREFLRILRASPKLHTLTICESGPRGMPTDWLESLRANPLPDTPPENPLLDISLPSVKSLVLAYLSPPYVLALLDHLSFPKLTALAFDFEADEFMPVVERLTQPTPGTSRSLLSGLENLKISGLPCAHPPTLAAMADALKNLKSLSINLDHVDPLWDSILGHTENVEAENVPPIYFPQLESLYITAPQPDSIRDIVETRKERGKPLKELYINKDTDMDDVEESWFRDNVEVFDYFEGSDEESLYEFDASEVDVGEWDDPIGWDDEEEEEVDDEDFDEDEDEIPL